MSAAEVVLVTGGGSGIGAGLASAFHARGHQVIVVGHRRERVEAVAAGHPGMDWRVADVADPEQVAALAEEVGRRWPRLSTVINNAGVQHLFDFAAPGPLDAAELGREIDVNLKGVIHIANAMLPLLKTQQHSRLVNVGSGLGYVPLAAAPVYSATKAGVHSFTLALRRQLRDTPVQVVELIPPVVATDLHRHLEAIPPMAMDLDAFTKAALAGLDAGRDEVVVGLAKVLRTLSRAAPSLGMKIVNQ